MLKTIIFYAGFLLIIVLCTEEMRTGLLWARATLERYPQWKFIAYPLAVLLGLAVVALIVNFLVTLFLLLGFSYD